MSVLIETSFGDITVDIWTEKAPITALNFLKLCKMKHYNNSLFIQVQKNHIARVQTQNPTTIWSLIDPQNGNKVFNDQIDHQLKFKEIGYLATANRGPNQNNSEFFITLTKADLSSSLNGKHTIFGKVEEGLDVLRKINDSFCDKNNRPEMNIRILHTFILDDPFGDLENMSVPIESPQIARNSDRLEAIEHLQMLEKYEKQDNINESIKKQKAKKQAVTLQMLGDLPDANIKPPENILFVCKMNPITQQRDLEIIFSRFGPIKSVQIVRDWKTGQSLQYGFIEFQTPTACEEAYLKMNNVLIDDRRIQVDFSQSVSKLVSRNRKPNEPLKKLVKEQQSFDNREKLVKSGRKIEDRYNIITQKPDYAAARNDRRQQYRERIEELRPQRNQKEERSKQQKKIKEESQVEQSVQQKKKKKDKKKKEKKSKRSPSQESRQDKKYKRRLSSSQSERAEKISKKHHIEKDRKRDKKDKKDKKQKKEKKDRYRSDSN